MLALAVGAVGAVGAAGVGGAVTLDPALTEVSGMALSGGTLYVTEDSGAGPDVHALDAAGQVRATWDLALDARDWEDLAAGPDGDLVVADIGDNSAVRDRGVLLHRLAAPTGDGGGAGPVESFRLVYEDGPRDAETLLVHPLTGQTLVVTKGFLGSEVYAAPQPLAAGTLTRQRTLDFPVTDTPGGPDIGAAATVLPTGGAVSPDGRRIAVRTYTDLHVWEEPGRDLLEAFDGPRTVLPLPRSRQGEAVTWVPDGSAVLVTGEGAAVPVERVDVPAAAGTPTPPPGEPTGPAASPSTPPGSGPAGSGPSSGGLPDVVPWVLVGAALLGAAGLVGLVRGRE